MAYPAFRGVGGTDTQDLVVKFEELKLGDVLLAWQYAADGPVMEFNSVFTVTRLDSMFAYLNNSHEYVRDDGPNCRYVVRRPFGTVSDGRVPCAKCGKRLHPGLSSTKGYTHGC